MAVDTFIFDCDGTILNTLPDLAALTNGALREMGFPERSVEEIETFIGHGARRLIEQAVPAGCTPEEMEKTLTRWQELYPEYGFTYTKAYEGIPETLAELKTAGAKLAVLSNKFDAATRSVCENYFPNVFDAVHGERPGIPRKPDPRGLLMTIDELGSTTDSTVYIGDSPVDAEVGRNAGCGTVCVDWGFNPLGNLEAACPDRIISAPDQLLALL
jgi:phosphoglycolate phosphatase